MSLACLMIKSGCKKSIAFILANKKQLEIQVQKN